MRKDTGIPGRRPRIPALCRLPLTALAVVLTFLLGAAAPAYAAKPARPAVCAPGKSGAPAAASTNSEEEKHSKRETERSRPRRLTPAAEESAPTRRPLPPQLTGAGEGTATGHNPATDSAPASPRPTRLPLLHCVFRC
ncbi:MULTISPECIES: hypothetical protein [Streptomyces]|uniref:Uncharacterized protein n=2 Tax=Streptomyces TaxID=1883 RepID=A0A2N8PJ38_STRNR|nr:MULTISPECIES: hypothetical protein [Streptomyces]PNE41039.1 hypothetical protein AOB60_09890 [Streptomyces noursei]SHN11695.1 hypothetical protein SAMN05216268_12019 [Streptomyces yunnanensis]